MVVLGIGKRRRGSTPCMFALALVLTASHAWTTPRESSPSKSSIRSTTIALHRSSDDDFFEDDNDEDAKSQFGTKQYWDELYQGRGDFPSDEYQWYFGFEKYGRLVQTHVPLGAKVLVPGIGNDPILVDLLQKGYTRLTGTDYSQFAIERQQDLLTHQGYDFLLEDSIEEDDDNTTVLCRMDARKMPASWECKFDVVIEKGVLDAIYLSGDRNIEIACQEIERILQPQGILISVSGVVPTDLRKRIFDDWNWIRDGSDDLEAGSFVLKKR